MSDLFLVLGQTEGGLTCFVVPRVLADGTRNVFRIQRLKEKLGNRSNASSEIEFSNTWAQRLGDEGRGVKTIVEMVSATRLDCVLGSTALMRKALSEAIWHTEHRAAFGKQLIDQPLMRQVLADLAIEVEAATWLSMRLAAATDRAVGAAPGAGAEHEAALRRIALPMSKYFVCKRTAFTVAEAMECLGGPGYVEETGLPVSIARHRSIRFGRAQETSTHSTCCVHWARNRQASMPGLLKSAQSVETMRGSTRPSPAFSINSRATLPNSKHKARLLAERWPCCCRARFSRRTLRTKWQMPLWQPGLGLAVLLAPSVPTTHRSTWTR